MNKNFNPASVFSLQSSNTPVDKETQKAQKQWVKDGTVNSDYLKQVLGDISLPVSAFIPEDDKEELSRKALPAP